MPAAKTGNQSYRIAKQIAKVLDGECVHKHLCPIKDILSRFGDKWSLYTILLIGQYEKRRFNELRSCIPGISQRMLTVTLRTLEEDGIILRTHFPEIPPRVEYELTEMGKSLSLQLLSLATWADKNFANIIKSRKRYAKQKNGHIAAV